MKYMWTLTGQCIIALPLLLSVAGEVAAKDSTGVSQRTKMYATAKHYLINGGDAAERIMSSYKEVCGGVLWVCCTTDDLSPHS